MGSLADQIFAHAQHAGEVRYGFIESVGDGLASVRMAGATIEGATWVSRYLPVVGERVAVIAADTGWLVLGAVTDQEAVWNEPTTLLSPTTGTVPDSGATGTIYDRYMMVQRRFSDGWDDDLSTPGIDPKRPTAISGSEWEVTDPAYAKHALRAGLGPTWLDRREGDYLNYQPEQVRSAILIRTLLFSYVYSDQLPPTWLDTLLPSEAEVINMSLRIRLAPPSPAVEGVTPESGEMRTFTVYPANPDLPPFTPENMISTAVPPLTVSASPGTLAVLPIPDDWLAAFAAREINGWVIWPGDQPFIHFSDEFTLGADGQPEWSTEDLFYPSVDYVTPREED